MKEKNNNGITLVALVVTIVILVILAGISIQAINNTGLFANAKQAKKKQEQAQELENSILTDYTGKISQYIDGKRGESSNESYNDLENVSRTFFSNNIINLKNRKSVVSTETTTATDLNKLVATITIPDEIINSEMISMGTVYLELHASESKIYLQPSKDGFMYVMYNDTKYLLYENDKFIDSTIPLIEGVKEFYVYAGWNNYHTNAYVNLNLEENYIGKMTNKNDIDLDDLNRYIHSLNKILGYE